MIAGFYGINKERDDFRGSDGKGEAVRERAMGGMTRERVPGLAVTGRHLGLAL